MVRLIKKMMQPTEIRGQGWLYIELMDAFSFSDWIFWLAYQRLSAEIELSSIVIQFHNGFSICHMTCTRFSQMLSLMLYYCVLSEGACANRLNACITVWICVYAYESQRRIQTPTCYQGYQKTHAKWTSIHWNCSSKHKIGLCLYIFSLNATVGWFLPFSEVYKGKAQPIRNCKVLFGTNSLWVWCGSFLLR